MRQEHLKLRRKTLGGPKSPIDLRPDFLLGYLIGLIIGDGWVHKTRFRNYVVALETTRKDYATLFSRTFHTRFPSLTVFRYERMKKRKFPNGQITNSRSYVTWVNCKQLYLVLRPCKMSDYHWTIPELVLKSKEAQRGFLRGIFDAEGSVDVLSRHIRLCSKHKANLRQVQRLLRVFGVKSYVQGARSELRVVSRGNCILFRREVGFGYLPKRRKLARICKVKYGPKIVDHARRLRLSGLTYSEIAKRLGVASPVSVSEWLRGKKLPYSVRNRWAIE